MGRRGEIYCLRLTFRDACVVTFAYIDLFNHKFTSILVAFVHAQVSASNHIAQSIPLFFVDKNLDSHCRNTVAKMPRSITS